MTILELLVDTPFYLNDHCFLQKKIFNCSRRTTIVQVEKEFSLLKYTFSVVACQVLIQTRSISRINLKMFWIYNFVLRPASQHAAQYKVRINYPFIHFRISNKNKRTPNNITSKFKNPISAWNRNRVPAFFLFIQLLILRSMNRLDPYNSRRPLKR